MFKRLECAIISNPTCSNPIDEIIREDFRYYDKDGFELNIAEQKYYRQMKRPLDYNILNHSCWQEPWFVLEKNHQSSLILDHCIILHRANYSGAAATQLERVRKEVPEADLLLKTKVKWGFDFALDSVADNGEVFEVLHVEYDSLDYETFANHMISFEYTVRHTDWINAAKRVFDNKDKWQHLKGFEQNHWKSNFLIGWKKAEYTEKSLTL